MKKRFFLFNLLSLMLATVWAVPASFTIEFKDSGTSTDSNTGLTSTTVADYVVSGAEYVSEVTATGKVYNAQSGYGLKFGNSSNPGTLTLTLANPVKPTSIVMSASQYGKSEGTGLLQDATYDMTEGGGKGSFNDYTYTYDGSTTITAIVIGTPEKRGYVKSVTVNYEKEGSEIVATAISLDQPTLELQEDESATLVAALTPADATTPITWHSSNVAVATVSAGKVTAIKKGSAVITATAGSVSDSCAVTVTAAPLISCAEAAALENGKIARLGDVVVTYVNGAYSYVKDESGYALVYQTNYGLEAGDIVSGFIGKSSPYSNLPELVPMVDYADLIITKGEAPLPEELETAPTEADINRYVILKGVGVEAGEFTDKVTNLTAKMGDQTFVLRNTFKLAQTFEEGKLYDIVGVGSIYQTTFQFYFISAAEHVEETSPLTVKLANPAIWNNVYLYAWNETTGEQPLGTWPGIVVNKNDEGWYSYTFDDKPVGTFGIIWHNNAGMQTANLYVESDACFRLTDATGACQNVDCSINPEQEVARPTTAPARPTHSEDAVMAVYDNHYAQNNLNFELLYWGGATWEELTIDETRVAYCQNMTWEALTNWSEESYDLSAYNKVHFSVWAPDSASIQLTIETSSTWKKGVPFALKKGWNTFDADLSKWNTEETSYDWKDVKYVFFDTYTTDGTTSFEGNPFAFANVYFWKDSVIPVDPTEPDESDLVAAGYDVENNIVTCFKFDVNPCYDVVFVGTYNGWSSDPEACVVLQPLNGFKDWYVAEVPYTGEDSGKPVQLDVNGKFDWEFQAGDVDAWIHKGGKTAEVTAGFGAEANIYYPSAGAYIYEIAYWKNHNNPCTAIYHNYTITVISDGCDGYAIPFIVGAMNSWTFQPMQLDTAKTQEYQSPTYYITFEAAEGTAYQIVSGLMDPQTGSLDPTAAPDWVDEAYMQMLVDDYWTRIPGEDGENQLTYENENIVWDLRADNLRWARCASDEPEEHVVLGVKLPAENCPEAVEIIGTFDNWAGTALEFYAETGWFLSYDIKAKASQYFKFRGAGSWEHEIEIYDVENDNWRKIGDGDLTFGKLWTDDTWKGDPVKWIELDLSDPNNYRWSEAQAPAEPKYPIVETYFATGEGWTLEDLSGAVYDVSGEKITVTIGADKVAQWQGQVKIQGPQAEAGVRYHVSLKMQANNDVAGVTLKWQDDNNDPSLIFEDKSISLVSGKEFVFDRTVNGIEGNGIMVIDFGFAHAGDVIEIYDIAFEVVTPSAISVAEALSIGQGSSSGDILEPTYDIVGYVTAYGGSEADGGYARYGNQIFWIADAPESTAASNEDGAFYVYQGVCDTKVNIGDKISVRTRIRNYNGILESEIKAPVTVLQHAQGLKILLSDVANYIDFQALSVSDPQMVAHQVTSIDPYTLANGTVLRGFLNPETGEEASNTWNVKEGYTITMPTPAWDNVDWLTAGTAFRAASHTTITLGTLTLWKDGKLTVYFQPNGDVERGVSLTINGGDTLTYLGSGVKIDGVRPAYAAEFALPAGLYEAGDIVITILNNTCNIYGIGIDVPFVPVDPSHLTVAQAVAYAKTLVANRLTDINISVEGYVVAADMYEQAFDNQTFYLVDNLSDATATRLVAYQATPTKDGKPYPVLVGDKVRITAPLQRYVNGSGEEQYESYRPTVEFLEQASGDRTLPEIAEITVAQALERAESLEPGYMTTAVYDVFGYVSYIEENAMSTYGNMTFWIVSDPSSRAASNADGAFYIYRGRPDTTLHVGDYIKVRTHVRKTAIAEDQSLVQATNSATVTYIALPVPTEEDLTAAGYEIDGNHVVLAYKFDGGVCNDVVLLGTHNDWKPDSAVVVMKPLEGFEGWYVAQVPFEGLTIEAKPVALKLDGSFSWEFQAGDADAWIHRGAQTAIIQQGYADECNVYYQKPGAYIYEVAYWKRHNNPCDVVSHDYTIRLYTPEACDSTMAPAVIGVFNNWETFTPFILGKDSLGREVYTITVKADERSEYKFADAIRGYDNELLYYVPEYDAWYAFGNNVFGTETELTFDYSDYHYYRYAQCEPKQDPPLCYYELVMTDSYGDGWNGGSLLATDGTHANTYTLQSGAYGREQIPYYGNEVQFIWTAGSWEEEVGFSILASNTACLFHQASGAAIGTGTLVYTMRESPCREEANPYAPQNIKAELDSLKQVRITWDAVDSVGNYILNIKRPDGRWWYYDNWLTDPAFTTGALPQTGDYTIIVEAWRNGLPLGMAEQTVYLQVPPMTSAHVSVLVPSDCGMDITDGLWLYWYTEDSAKIVPMKPAGERRFEATFNPNALSYNYSVLNKAGVYVENVQRTSEWTSITAEEHCSEVLPLYSNNWADLLRDDSCSNVNHDFRPIHDSVEIGEAKATFHWDMVTSPDECYVRAYYYNAQGELTDWSSNSIRQDSAHYSVEMTFSNDEPLEIAYWCVHSHIGNGYWYNYGKCDGFVVPGNSLLPTDLMATPNEDGTYTLSWQRHGEAVYRLYAYGYDQNGYHVDIASGGDVEGESFVTIDLTGFTFVAWWIQVYNESGDNIGSKYSEFSIRSDQSSHDLPIYIYIPTAAAFASESGYTLEWSYPGLATASVALESVGNNWYSTVLNVSQDYISVAVRNGVAEDTTTTLLSYQYSISYETYFVVSKDKDGKQLIRDMYNSYYYPRDYMPFNLEAEPADGKVTLRWSANEQAPRYYVQIFDETAERVWSGWVEADSCVATLSVDTIRAYTWSVVPCYNWSNYSDYLTVYGDTFAMEPSSLMPTNLRATDNGDGTFTLAWDAPKTRANYYELYVYDPNGSYVTGVYLSAGQTTFVTPSLPAFGRYKFYVYAYGFDGSASATGTFSLAPVDAHDITVRMLVHPDSGVENAEGITLSKFDYTVGRWVVCDTAVSEGEHWFAYTFSSNTPGARIRFEWNNGESYNTYTISGDTCFEYIGSNVYYAACDAVAHDYRLSNGSVETEPGKATFHWTMLTAPRYCYVGVSYRDASGYSNFRTGDEIRQDASDYTYEFAFNNNEDITVDYWVVYYYNAGTTVSSEAQPGFRVEARNYDIDMTFVAPQGAPQGIEVLGSFNNRVAVPMAYNPARELWEASITAKYGDVFRFRDAANPNNEPQYYNREFNAWYKLQDMAIRDCLYENNGRYRIHIDLSDTLNYSWRAESEDSVATDSILCHYELVMTDMYNDGWNGGRICITDGDHVLYFNCNESESPKTVQVPYYGHEARIYWVGSSYSSAENAIGLYASNGEGLCYHPQGREMTDWELLGTITESPCRDEANPSIPQNIKAAANENRTMTVAWDAVDSVDYYTISIQRPNGFMWYANAVATEPAFTTDILEKSGNYTFEVIAWRNNLPLGHAFQTQYVEVPRITSAHVSVLVPSDCDMDISEGIWIYWYTNEGEHVEPMTPLEGRRFEATFNPNATSYNYAVLNKSSLYADNLQRTYAWTNIIAEEHCSEVMRFANGATWASLRYDEGCDNPDHDYRPHNSSVEVDEGVATLHWQMTTVPKSCYAIIYYYDEQGNLRSRADDYAMPTDSGIYAYTFTLGNNEPFKVEYWAVESYTENGWDLFGHEDGFVVPATNILPTDLMATPNEDGTYTLTWKRPTDAEYRLYMYCYDSYGSYFDILSARLAEGESFTTPDLSAYVRAYWYIDVYNEIEKVGSKSSEFQIAHEQATRELSVKVYVPVAAEFPGEQYMLQWNYPGMPASFAPLASEGNNWYSAVLNVAQDYIYVAVRNADETDTTAIVLPYQSTVSNDIYLLVNKAMDGKHVLKTIGTGYYPHDYLPFNLKAEPRDGEVALSWSVNEQSPYYHVDITNEEGNNVWSEWIYGETQCVVSLSIDSAAAFTWSVITADANGNYYNSTIVYADAFEAQPSSYRPLNLKAVDNGDATFTITWDAPQMADIENYRVYLYNPSGMYITEAVCQEPTWTTPVLSVAGRYTYYVYVYGNNISDYAEATFVLEQIESHDINVRLLVHPDSGRENADSISLSFYSYATGNWTECKAESEGEHWYAYTFSSTNPGARILFSWNNGDNYNTFDIAETACFEYTGSNIRTTDCDAVAHDYRPKDITAVINADNSMSVNWTAVEGAVSYMISIYTPDGYQWVSRHVTDHYFASGVLQQNGVYTITVTSIDANGNRMASNSVEQDVELVNIGAATVTVLVPSDCAMPVDSGLWINWYVPGDTLTRIEPMVALEGRRFTANFNVPAPSFGYVVLNRPDYNYEGVHYTYSFDGITESAHCAEVLWSDYEAHSINKVEDCQLVDHDYRAFNLKAVSIPGRVEFSWEAKDVAQYSYLYLTDINTGRRYYANLYNTTEFTYLVEDFLDSMQMQWSILPYQPYRVEETYADSIVMLHKSEVEISNIKLTTTDSVTLDLTWHTNREQVNFMVNVLYSGYTVKSVVVSDTAFHHTAQWPGVYEVNITPLNAERIEIGRTVYPGSIALDKAPEPFTNLKGEANGHQLTFSWETALPMAYAEIYQVLEGDRYSYIDGLTLNANTFSYAVEEDGAYLLQIRPYIEYAPGEFSYIPYTMRAGVTAFTVKETFAVQLSATEGGYVWPEGLSGNYPAEYQLGIRAYSNDGYRFIGWSDGVENWSRTIVIASDTAVTAIFEPIPVYDITVQAGEGGHFYAYDYTEEIEQTDSIFHVSRQEGSMVYIEAYAAEGYVFSQWSDGVTAAWRDIVLTQDTALTALFIPHVRLTIPATEGGSVLVSGNYITHKDSLYTFVPGAAVELTAQPLDSFRFTGWSDSVTTIKRTLTLDADLTLKADFERITTEMHRYYVSVRSANDRKGSVNSVSGYYNEGDQIELTATPLTGYEFTGWSDGNKDNPRLLVVSKEEDLVAQFDIRKVTIRIEAAEGGSVNDSTVNGTYNYGTNVRIIATPDEHYRFTGWSDGAWGADRYVKLTADTVLMAAFEINPIFTLALTAGEGGMVRATGVDTFDTTYTRTFNEYDVAYIEAKANEGYSFYMWSDGSTNAVRSITMTEDLALTAIFQRLCRLTISTTEGGTVAFKGAYVSFEDSVYTINYGKEIALTATPAEGYRFVEWSSGYKGTTIIIEFDSDLHITAKFEKIPYYAVSVEAGEGGLIYATGMTGYAKAYSDTLIENTTIYVSATPNSGYSFDQWSDGSTDMTRVITLTENISLKATFRPLVHLTMDIIGQGAVEVEGTYMDSLRGVYTATYGTELTLTAIPAEGYRFTGWSDSVTTIRRTLTLEADLTLKATFEEAGTTPQYTVKVGTIGSGVGQVNTNGGVYYEGDQFELIATPGHWTEFTGWSDGNTDNPRTITVSGDSTINAVFSLFRVDLAISATEGGTVNDSVNGQYNIGSTVTIMATAAPHYFFTGWSDGVKTSIRQLYLDKDTALVASFEIEKHTVTFLNYNGDTLESKIWPYGEVPVCEIIPARAQDDSLVYTFSGWNPEIETVTADAAYTAVFDAQPRLYTVTFLNYNGDTIESKQWPYGEVPVCETQPTRAADDSLTYTFIGWEPEVVAVTAEAAYTALYESERYVFTVTFYDWDNTVLSRQRVKKGENATPPADPTREGYTFLGWQGNYNNVQQDEDVYATYEQNQGVDNVDAENAPRKVIIDGHVYIRRGDKLYTIHGQLAE